MKKTPASDSYRDRIFEKYASGFQDVHEQMDTFAPARWRKANGYYLRDWLPETRQAEVLDVACGNGNLLRFFKESGYAHIHGVDISPEQAMLAREVTPQVVAGDAIEFLSARPQQFDLITGLDIIEHLHKPEVLRFLDGCYMALKPDGRLILQTPNADSPWYATLRYGDFTHEVGFNSNALSRLMRLTGFVAIEAHERGPIPLGYSAISTVRHFIWQGIRVGLKVWNLAETGEAGSNIFTRVFLISGVKK